MHEDMLPTAVLRIPTGANYIITSIELLAEKQPALPLVPLQRSLLQFSVPIRASKTACAHDVRPYIADAAAAAVAAMTSPLL